MKNLKIMRNDDNWRNMMKNMDILKKMTKRGNCEKSSK